MPKLQWYNSNIRCIEMQSLLFNSGLRIGITVTLDVLKSACIILKLIINTRITVTLDVLKSIILRLLFLLHRSITVTLDVLKWRYSQYTINSLASITVTLDVLKYCYNCCYFLSMFLYNSNIRCIEMEVKKMRKRAPTV